MKRQPRATFSGRGDLFGMDIFPHADAVATMYEYTVSGLNSN